MWTELDPALLKQDSTLHAYAIRENVIMKSLTHKKTYLIKNSWYEKHIYEKNEYVNFINNLTKFVKVRSQVIHIANYNIMQKAAWSFVYAITMLYPPGTHIGMG